MVFAIVTVTFLYGNEQRKQQLENQASAPAQSLEDSCQHYREYSLYDVPAKCVKFFVPSNVPVQ